MPRGYSSAFGTELAGQYLRPCFFCQIQFTSGISYIWSGIGNIAWNGQTWSGVGSLGKISKIEESSEVKATNISLELSGIDSNLLHQAIGETRQGYPVQIWFGALSANPTKLVTGPPTIIADPWKVFSGRMDQPTIQEGADTSTISISVESRMVDLQRPRERRYTHQDQQIDFPGDLGFEYVESLQNWSGIWGKGTPTGIVDRHGIPDPRGGTTNGSGGGLRGGAI